MSSADMSDSNFEIGPLLSFGPLHSDPLLVFSGIWAPRLACGNRNQVRTHVHKCVFQVILSHHAEQEVARPKPVFPPWPRSPLPRAGEPALTSSKVM